jgi:hypothetical protein
MPLIPFGEYAPDVPDFRAAAGAGVATTQALANAVPTAAGYGPFQAFTAYTTPLPGPCRGYFYARKPDGSISVFAGTASKLYLLNNTDFTWTDVSKAGGSYSDVPSGDQWQFAQHGNLVLATQVNTVVQAFDLASPTAFADLGGAPPAARYIAIVVRFVVLSGIQDDEYAIRWSGNNAPAMWTPGTAESDTQTFPDGGPVRGVAGGQFGIIVQDGALRRMVYAPGSPLIFQIDRISEDHGILAPLSLVRGGDRFFFLGTQGFQKCGATGYPEPIGKERVDRTVLSDLDTGALHLMIGAADPRSTRVYWTYKSLGGQAGLFDTVLAYDYALDRFAPLTISGQYIASLSKPGLTLENLDGIAPGAVAVAGAANNGSGLIRLTVASTAGWADGDTKSVTGVGGTTEANGHWSIQLIDATHVDLLGSTFVNPYTSGGVVGGSLDALDFSLDDVSTATLSRLSMMNPGNVLGFFDGEPLEATFETPERGAEDKRMHVHGFRPLTDAGTVHGSLGRRETLSGARIFTAEVTSNSHGLCHFDKSARYVRARVRIPAGETWTYAAGIEPLVKPAGSR